MLKTTITTKLISTKKLSFTIYFHFNHCQKLVYPSFRLVGLLYLPIYSLFLILQSHPSTKQTLYKFQQTDRQTSTHSLWNVAPYIDPFHNRSHSTEAAEASDDDAMLRWMYPPFLSLTQWNTDRMQIAFKVQWT